MHVGVQGQISTPGVKHGGEADLGVEAGRGDVVEGLGGGGEQHGVDDLWKLPSEGTQLARQGEDDLVMADWDGPLNTGFNPPFEEAMGPSAVGAQLHMATSNRGAAGRDVPKRSLAHP